MLQFVSWVFFNKLSEESLSKLRKPELTAFSMNIQEKNESIQHDVKNQVRRLKECIKKLEGELVDSLNRLADIERRYWATAQCSRHECVEVAVITQSVPASDLEKIFLKFWRKL